MLPRSCFAFLIAFAVTMSASAAPFCVFTDYGEKCSYYDIDGCRRAAALEHGVCVANPNEQKKPSGGAPFCAVTPSATNCWYYDTNCQGVAKNSHGRCIPNPER